MNVPSTKFKPTVIAFLEGHPSFSLKLDKRQLQKRQQRQ